MAAPETVHYRRANGADVASTYALFRRSLFDYLFRQALVDEATAKDPPIEAGWRRQSAWIEHLWATAAENWVAVDGDGNVLGWALSVERDGSLELTHFFVEPATQARGIGRGLLERTFPLARGRHRTIVATQDARALGLYLKFGVGHVATSADFIVHPEPFLADRSDDSGLAFERLAPDDASVDAIAGFEREILGYRRDVDVRFLLGMRPAWLARRAGRPIGFAFGAQPIPPGLEDEGAVTGPIGALDATDLPALIDHIAREARDAGVPELYVTPPLCNRAAVGHLLARGAKIDPFYVMVLASDESMRLDRWIHTGPIFIM